MTSLEMTQSGATNLPVLDGRSIYASLCSTLNMQPVSALQPLEIFETPAGLSGLSAEERIAQAIGVFMTLLSGLRNPADRLDGSLLDFHVDRLDEQVSAQLDATLHAPEFQALEARWRGAKFDVEHADFRKNVRIELLDLSKEELMRDFDDMPELIQSGLYRHTYIDEYDTPGGQPISALISDYEFTNAPRDIGLLRNISKVAAVAHMPFIGSVGPAFFGKQTMDEVLGIQDLAAYLERAEFIKWNQFRDTADARYVGLTMPRVLGRLPYGTSRVPRSGFSYREEVKGPGHDRYLWLNASFAFAANLMRSFMDNGWCVQIRGPQAGGRVDDLPVQLYDLGVGYQAKIPAEALVSETREFEFAHLGFIPLSFYENHDCVCFFSANSAQRPALLESRLAQANSRINARLPYIFLLSQIAHCLKLIQRENIGSTKDKRVLELELNNWIKELVTQMKDPGDALQSSHPLREAKVTVEDIEDNPGFFRIHLFIVPHFQIEGMDIGLSLVSQMPKAKG